MEPTSQFHSDESTIFVPEVITPNGDKFNDTWNITWGESVHPSQYTIDLYDQSQRIVLSRKPIREAQQWNAFGTPEGVYWWILYCEIETGSREAIQRGGLTIRR